MLHRVVLKRSGRPSPEASALGFTGAHNLICAIVGKPVIAAGYSMLDRVVPRSLRGGRAADFYPQGLLKPPCAPSHAVLRNWCGSVEKPRAQARERC